MSHARLTPPYHPPHPLWSPLVAAGVVLAPGLAALATSRLLLFPSLAPTAVLQAHAPAHPSSRFYNVVVSHVIGLAAAYGAVYLLGLAHAPSVFAVHAVSTARVAAATLAVGVGTLGEILLRATHAPAASTTLLVALGSFGATLRDAEDLVIGVLIVALVGEGARRLRLRAERPRSF